MKLGIRSDTWPGLTLIEEFKKVASFGFRHINVVTYKKDSKEFDKEAVRVFHDLGLISNSLSTCALYQVCLSDPAQRQKAMDLMKRDIDFQLELGGKQIGGLTGVFTMEYPRERAWVDSVEFMREYAEWALPMGICIDVETEPEAYHVAYNLEQTIRWHQQVNMPNVYVNLDTGHLNVMRVPPHALDALRGKCIHCHITDEDGWTHSEITLGTGTTDNVGYIHKILELGIEEEAAKHGIKAVAAIELIHVPDMDQSVKQSLEHLAEVLPELTF